MTLWRRLGNLYTDVSIKAITLDPQFPQLTAYLNDCDQFNSDDVFTALGKVRQEEGLSSWYPNWEVVIAYNPRMRKAVAAHLIAHKDYVKQQLEEMQVGINS